MTHSPAGQSAAVASLPAPAALAPITPRYAPHTMVCTADNLATEAGVQMLRLGGSAVDAALAASAVLTATLPNQCGLGGDLFAPVHLDGEIPLALDASGRPRQVILASRQALAGAADPRALAEATGGF